MKELCNNAIRISLHMPGDGYYRGTRFDRAGVFGAIETGDGNWAGEWFPAYDPYAHDAVCGPAEEFSPIIEGRRILKLGVGILEMPDDSPYDRFRLYPVVSPGTWETHSGPGSCTFTHIIGDSSGWGCRYSKTILLTGCGFRISHILENTGSKPLQGDMYNHNFFTFGNLQTGPSRSIGFGFDPEGKWRAEYESVLLEGRRLRFTRSLRPGESVYMGDIRGKGDARAPYLFTISDGGKKVTASSATPLHKAVFWANDRIACIEPYVLFSAGPGEVFRMDIDYAFFQ